MIHKIGIVANPEKKDSLQTVTRCILIGRQFGWEIYTESESEVLCKGTDIVFASLEELATNVDILLVVGGDGTMLRVARHLKGFQIPLLGIKQGRLGFLTPVTTDELEDALEKLKNGEFTLEKRVLLGATGAALGQSLNLQALNDFVLSRGIESRMIELNVYVDNEFLACYRCDGLIISTPTGSTAYTLSAGGAIVVPTASVLSITPICPHSFRNRTVIVNGCSVVKVQMISEKLKTILSVDGQKHFEMNFGDTVEFQNSSQRIVLVKFANKSFFKTLQEKLFNV